jgi:hypothetical protein
MRLASVPLKSVRCHTPAAFFQQCRAKPTSAAPLAHSTIVTRRPNSQPSVNESRLLQTYGSRLFSTSLSWRATVVKQNPRADDDGNDMTIEISETAAKVRPLPRFTLTATNLFSEIAPDHQCAAEKELPRILISSRIPPPRHRHLGRLPRVPVPHVTRGCREDRSRGGYDICIGRECGRGACRGRHGLCLAGVAEGEYHRLHHRVDWKSVHDYGQSEGEE